MRPALGVKMSGIGEHHEPSRDPFGPLEQGQGVREDVVAILSSEQGQTDRDGQCCLETPIASTTMNRSLTRALGVTVRSLSGEITRTPRPFICSKKPAHLMSMANENPTFVANENPTVLA